LNPRSAYVALWIDILARRRDLPSQLAAQAVQFEMKRWPAPIVVWYLGQATESDVLAAADEDKETKTERLCTAYFFGGQPMLSRHAKDDATRLFRLAAENCTNGTVIRVDALSELKELGAAP